jgi:hypothetical protein
VHALRVPPPASRHKPDGGHPTLAAAATVRSELAQQGRAVSLE